MTTELKCTSCGADLEYFGTDPAITCNYCGSVVIVPRELRKAQERKEQQELQESYSEMASEVVTATTTSAKRGCTFAILGIGVAIALFGGVITFILARVDENDAMQAVNDVFSSSEVDVVLEFGGEGPGAGLFQDAAAIAVDGQDHVYVADYETGRVQVFDAEDGEYITQWRIEEEYTYVMAMAGGPGTELYVSLSSSDILVYDGMAGEKLRELTHPELSGLDDIAVGPDGSIVSFWWSLDEYLVRWAPDGKVDLQVVNAISSVIDDSEMDGSVAVDGLGNIYVLGGFTRSVFRFSQNGTYQNRFGSEGDDEDQFRAPGSIAVSPAGDVYVSDFSSIKVFGSDGRFLRSVATDFYAMDMVFDYYGYLWVLTSTDTVMKLSLD